ncbi:MAG: hypothetical protein ACYC0V_13295 [Armatimonadota bacterium]
MPTINLTDQDIMRLKVIEMDRDAELLAACMLAVPSYGKGPVTHETGLDSETERLIARLAQVSEADYGFDPWFRSSEFLPYSDSGQAGLFWIGTRPPVSSPIVRKIVMRGIRAVPSLLKHLDDSTVTKIPSQKGMMWTSFEDEYDYNHRTRKKRPEGVNLNTFGKKMPSSHTVTVGDLCFVALGQIVNRDFNATRYQPSGGLVVNSTSYSRHLCAVVRADFAGINEQKHRQLLVQDFTMPDGEGRRIGAYNRLAFYYPEAVEALVLKQLSVPAYDVFEVERVVREELYPATSTQRRKVLFDRFVQTHGRAAPDGIRRQLFLDLDDQIANEEKRLHPPMKKAWEARDLLIQLYGYKSDVKVSDEPYADTWGSGDRAQFIAALTHDKSVRIDRAVDEIFRNDKDDDLLAIGCMSRLNGRGYDQDIRRYCERRIGKDKGFSDDLKQILARVNARRNIMIVCILIAIPVSVVFFVIWLVKQKRLVLK